MKDDRLLAYLAGTLDPAAAEAFEEELFTDEALAHDAARFTAIFDLLRERARSTPLSPVITKDELTALEERYRVRKHRPVDGAIHSRIADEDFVVGILTLDELPNRIHLVICTPDGVPYFRVNDAPFDREAREVVVLCEREVALSRSALLVRVLDDHDGVLASVAITNEPVTS